MVESIQLPTTYHIDVAKAVQILLKAGCTEIYLFGSLATGEIHTQSDIDLAVRGCPKKDFFRVYAQLMKELDYPVDLVDLDTSEDMFARFLVEEEELVQIA